MSISEAKQENFSAAKDKQKDKQHVGDFPLPGSDEYPVAIAEDPAKEDPAKPENTADANLKAVARIFALGAARAMAAGVCRQSGEPGNTVLRNTAVPAAKIAGDYAL